MEAAHGIRSRASEGQLGGGVVGNEVHGRPSTTQALHEPIGVAGCIGDASQEDDLVGHLSAGDLEPVIASFEYLLDGYALHGRDELVALLVDDPDSQELPADYQEQLKQAITDTEALDAAVAAGDRQKATELLATVKKGCNTCHADYRNR